jgi:hypothetical protein
MNPTRILPIAALVTTCLFASPLCEFAARVPAPQPPQSEKASGAVVYVSDFDLDVYRPGLRMRRPRTFPGAASAASPGALSNGSASGSSTTSPPNSSTSSPRSPSNSARPTTHSSSTDPDSDDNVMDRANELINLVAENVVSALRTAGYPARRSRLSQPRPEKGLLIRGVFAEPDEKNRARRLFFGGPGTSPRMLIYVGVNNLARPEQPFYEFADPPAPDSRYGPVITVTSYSPVARFELEKNPSDDQVKKFAAQIAADLTALLQANPLLAQNEFAMNAAIPTSALRMRGPQG